MSCGRYAGGRGRRSRLTRDCGGARWPRWCEPANGARLCGRAYGWAYCNAYGGACSQTYSFAAYGEMTGQDGCPFHPSVVAPTATGSATRHRPGSRRGRGSRHGDGRAGARLRAGANRGRVRGLWRGGFRPQSSRKWRPGARPAALRAISRAAIRTEGERVLSAWRGHFFGSLRPRGGCRGNRRRAGARVAAATARGSRVMASSRPTPRVVPAATRLAAARAVGRWTGRHCLPFPAPGAGRRRPEP